LAAVSFPYALHTTNAANIACRKGRLLVNGEPVSGAKRLKIGDQMTLTTAGDRRTTLSTDPTRAEKFCQTRINLFQVLSQENHTHAPLRVLYEDDSLAIVCKPAGIHSMAYKQSLCLDDLLPLLLQPPTQSEDALSAPLPRHRLDARVAGPVVVAKTRTAMVDITRSFENRLVEKEYRAILVGGNLEQDSYEIDADIDGRPSHTRVVVLQRTPCAVDGTLTDVALFPTSGRRHQLRRHCAEVLGAPILGDDLYTEAEDVRKRIGLFLYCRRVAVPHPLDGTQMISAEIDEPYRFARHKTKAAKGYKLQQEQEQ
jgi:23S rRNA pseudouridine1911/1915/1917 synthase